MTLYVEAFFEGGVLRPTRQLALPEGQPVRLTVETIDQASEDDRRRALDRFIAGALSMGFRSAGAYPSRDQLHDGG